MEKTGMSIPVVMPKSNLKAFTPQNFEGSGPADLREYLDVIEAAGELKRITAEVDPIEEMSAIVYLAAREIGAPAFLFERVEGYPTGVLWNMWGSSRNRLAAAMGLPMGLSLKELIQAVRYRLTRRITPLVVDSRKPKPVLKEPHIFGVGESCQLSNQRPVIRSTKAGTNHAVCILDQSWGDGGKCGNSVIGRVYIAVRREL